MQLKWTKNHPKSNKSFKTQTEGIEECELAYRVAADEYQHCHWPKDRKGGHNTLDCFQWKYLETESAPLPNNTEMTKT
jgi:hypothetical protein